MRTWMRTVGGRRVGAEDPLGPDLLLLQFSPTAWTPAPPTAAPPSLTVTTTAAAAGPVTTVTAGPAWPKVCVLLPQLRPLCRDD